MTTPQRAVRSTLALLTLGALALGTLTGCAPAQSLTEPPLSLYATRADAATLVFRARTGRAGAVDVLVGGKPVLRQVLASDPYQVTALPTGRQTLSVRTSYNGTLLTEITVDLRAGESYALSFENYWAATDYRLRIGRGSGAVFYLVNADW
jgi:hypothetical protein